MKKFTRFGLWLAIFAHKIDNSQLEVTLVSWTIEQAAENAKIILAQIGMPVEDFALVSLQASDGGVFGLTEETQDEQKKAPDQKAEGVLKFPKPN